MPNWRTIIKSIQEPKDRHYHWTRKTGEDIQLKKLAGYEFVKPDEKMKKDLMAKGRFNVGTLSLSKDGLIELGDLVLMETPKKDWLQRRAERHKLVDEDFDKYIAGGADLAQTGLEEVNKFRKTKGPLPTD